MDTSPIEISSLHVGSDHLIASPPLKFQVTFDKAASCYDLEGDLEIYLYAFSRQELESSLNELLEFMWLDYAREDDEAKLAPSGMQLKLDLLNRFSGV